MSNYSKIYWLTRLDYLQGLLTIAIVVIAIGLTIYAAFFFSAYDNQDREDIKEKFGRLKNWLILSVVIIGLLLCFIPSKDEAIEIYAGGKTMDFIQTDSSINKIPAQTTMLITNFLKKQIDSAK